MVGPGQGLLQPTRVLALQPAGSELQIPGLTASAGCHSDGRESSRGEPHPGVPTETLSGTGIPASRWQNLGLDLDTVAAGARLTQTSGEQMWWGGVGKARLETGRGAGCPGLVGTELRGGGPRLGWPALSAPWGGAQGSPRKKDVEVQGGGRHPAVHSAQTPVLGREVLGARGSRSPARRLRGG